jgi:hypothetical protein
MSGIFISYRREDSAPYAGRIYDRLSAYFGADHVFMDVDDIPPGANFVAQIETKVATCDAMVAVIGKNWLTARNASGRSRLSDPNDFVGLELLLALKRGVLVIPVLVGGATMPAPEDLRADLKPLAERNAVTLNDQDFQRDVDLLIQALEKIPGLQKLHGAGDKRAIGARWQKSKKAVYWKAPVIFILLTFALWWQWRRDQQAQTLPSSAQQPASQSAAALAGIWTGEVTYSWGAKYTERFFFQPEGDKLFGTATFLGTKRGIEDGKWAGEAITFSVRFQEILDGNTRERMNRYTGKQAGNSIQIRLQDDRGNVPVEFTVVKTDQPS